MNPKKSKDIKSALLKKGFCIDPSVDHHEYYILIVNGKKSLVKTFFSHGKKEYDKTLLGKMKKQLKFTSNENFEGFIDCPFSGDDYLQMLRESGQIKM